RAGPRRLPAARLLLGPRDRPLRRAVVHRRRVPGVAGQPLRRRPPGHAARPPRRRGRAGDGRGAPPDGPEPAHPRRAPGAGRRALPRHRRGGRGALADHPGALMPLAPAPPPDRAMAYPSLIRRSVEVWRRPGVRRLRQVGYWLLVGALAFFVYRRFAPSVTLDDLGPAPPLEMAALDGETVRLDDLRGRVVVVNVWATWCPPCRVETPGFVGLQEEFAGEVRFLGLST